MKSPLRKRLPRELKGEIGKDVYKRQDYRNELIIIFKIRNKSRKFSK